MNNVLDLQTSSALLFGTTFLYLQSSYSPKFRGKTLLAAISAIGMGILLLRSHLSHRKKIDGLLAELGQAQKSMFDPIKKAKRDLDQPLRSFCSTIIKLQEVYQTQKNLFPGSAFLKPELGAMLGLIIRMKTLRCKIIDSLREIKTDIKELNQINIPERINSKIAETARKITLAASYSEEMPQLIEAATLKHREIRYKTTIGIFAIAIVHIHKQVQELAIRCAGHPDL